jgi:predicted ArsR family transcriptional regulator
MKYARHRIIEIFESRRNASAVEISRILNTTPANIRHHLSILLEEGVIEAVGERSLPGAGRPPVVYALSRQTQTYNLDGLAVAMLEDRLGGILDTNQTAILRSIAQKLVKTGIPLKGNLTQRLYQAIQRLNEMHYLAHWEARAEAPLIILGHCPYAPIIADHQELCRLDALLIEELLNIPVKQSACLVQDTNGSTYCMFMTGG